VHIPDGILPAQVCAAGYAVTGLATWYSLRQIGRKPDPTAEIPKASLLTAAFFVASSIYIPIPPASVHLILNGLLGVVLGYFAFPAILIGLFFQALVIGHGGLTTLGVNAAMMGIPALLAYHIFQLRLSLGKGLPEKISTALFAFLGGALGLGIAALIFLTLVITTIPADFDAGAERSAIMTLSLGHIPLMVLEGVFTAMLVLFLQRAKPELLEG
jgi:cobalt/nickel transport system permease protein